jgi:hypothetical protein
MENIHLQLKYQIVLDREGNEKYIKNLGGAVN